LKPSKTNNRQYHAGAEQLCGRFPATDQFRNPE
jgi:hypothetical protein